MLLYVLLSLAGLLAALVIFLLVCGALVSNKKYYTEESRFYRNLIMVITAVIFKIGRVKLHISGTEKLPEGKKLLFVGNHLSNFDPMVTYYAFPQWRISYIAKASIINMPLFGRYIRRCCFMDIDRENPRNAIITINRAAELLKKQEVSIGVYPEGTRSKNGELLPFHNGVFKIAQKADADIAVVALEGVNQIAKNFPWHKTHVYVNVLEVIPANEVDPRKTELVGGRVEQLFRNYKREEERLI